MSNEPTRRHFLKVAAAVATAAMTTATGVHAAGRPSGGGSAGESGGAKPIIDSHAHLKHGDAERTEYSPEVIVATMDKVGISRSVVFAMSTTATRSIEMAESAVKKFPDRLIPYVYALPNYERAVIVDIERVLSGKLFRGIKIHAGECTLADYVVDPVLKVAGKYKVPCLIDLAGNYAVARRMAEGFPQTRLIVAHMGKYLSTDKGQIDRFIGLAERCGNVFLDVSGVVLVEMIEQAVRRIGSTRLLWGTDGPHEKPDTAGFAREELDKIVQLKIGREDKDNILGQTALKLLGLQEGGTRT